MVRLRLDQAVQWEGEGEDRLFPPEGTFLIPVEMDLDGVGGEENFLIPIRSLILIRTSLILLQIDLLAEVVILTRRRKISLGEKYSQMQEGVVRPLILIFIQGGLHLILIWEGLRLILLLLMEEVTVMVVISTQGEGGGLAEVHDSITANILVAMVVVDEEEQGGAASKLVLPLITMVPGLIYRWIPIIQGRALLFMKKIMILL